MGGLGGMDINNLLSNPSLMSMATSMMSDPNVQQMMGQFMSGGVAQGGSPTAGGGMEGLLQAYVPFYEVRSFKLTFCPKVTPFLCKSC